MDLIINGNNTTITEWNGLYRLADIHKAAGSPVNKKPTIWLRQIDTKEYIKECHNLRGAFKTPLTEKVSGKGKVQGTYAHKLIALEYARYLDKKLSIIINQVFDDFLNGKIAYITKLEKVITNNNVMEWVDANTASGDNDIKLSAFHKQALCLGYISKTKRGYVSHSNHIKPNDNGTLIYSEQAVRDIISNIPKPRHSFIYNLFFK